MKRPFPRHCQAARLAALAAAASLVIAMLAATAAQASPARTKATSRTAPLTIGTRSLVPPSLERAIQESLGTRDVKTSDRPDSPQKLGGPWSQTGELDASDGAVNNYFGSGVALSSDGTTALVGAPWRNSFTGVAYVFTQNGGSWFQAAELEAPNGAPNDYFGWSLALSSDGTTALVGAEGPNSFTGAAYIFTHVLTERGGSWTQTAELEASDGAPGDGFGHSVALSSDGTTALVGGEGHNSNTGAAYVFAQNGGSWSQTAELKASDGTPNDAFGLSVALSSDGTTGLVGAPGDNSLTGAAYVFAQSGGSWSQTAELKASDGTAKDFFGWSLALSSDGTTALAGAYGHNSGIGAAYVFAQSGGSWSQTAELKASDGTPNDTFGYAVVLSSDGTTALVGAPWHSSFTGAAYVFAQNGGSWSQTAELEASDGMAKDHFGFSTALSSDGTTALVGAPWHSSFTGAAYVFMKTGARLVFRPASGPPGSTTRLLGGGFTPGETVDTSVGNHSGKVTANSKGQFSLNLKVPAGAKSGQKVRATANGEMSGLSAHARFTVT